MSEATRFEVMSYSEKKSIQAQTAFALVTNAGQSAESIVNSILLAAAGASLDTLATVLPAYLTKNGGLATVFKTLDIADVDMIIENEIFSDYKNIVIAMKAGLGQGVGGIHANLYETLTGTNAMLQSYRSLVQKIAIDPYIQRWANDAYRPNIASDETAWFMNNIGALGDDKYKECVHQSGWSDDWIPALESAWTRQPPIEMLLDFKRRGYIDENTLRALLKWFRLKGDTLENTMKLTVRYPEPYRLAEMYSKGLLKYDDFISTMGKFGIEYDYAVAWAGAQMQWPTFDQCMMMYRRGIIGEDDFKLYMNFQQFGEWQVNQMLQLKDVIPPIQDLIRFAVREAYGEHDPEKQYSAMVDIAKKMGLTEQASEWYWYAHWDRIPVNLMFANYHRGLWDKTKLERMLKIVDIHPDDRADIMNVAYQPPTTRELGYGWDVGAYTLDDIKRFRRFGGLSPEDAEKAATSLVAYRTEGERNSVRTELMYAYGFERIDEDTLRLELQALNTPVEAIELWVQRAVLYRERLKKPTTDMEGRIVSSSEALTAFKLKLREEAWTRQALTDLDWTADRIEVAIERVKLDITEEEAKTSETKYRKLTISQLQKMYNLRIINKEQMTTEITLIGYNPDDAELLTEIYTKEAPTEVKFKPFTSAVAANMYNLMLFDEDDLYDNFIAQDWSEFEAAMLTMYTILIQELPRLRLMYEKGVITGETMVKELMKIEVPELNARALVQKTYDELQIERLSHEKDLTKAEIIKGAKNNVLTPREAAELLQGIGYDENEAYYILAINKVVSAGDPEGYWDMRKVTESYKKARGEKAVDIPDELIMLEKQQKQLKAQLDEAKKHPENEQAIADLVLKLGGIETQMKQIIIAKALKL